MATKRNPGQYDAYAAAEPDEPIFTLRANDPTAPAMVRGWAMNRVHAIFQGHKPNTPDQWHKVSEAVTCAFDMEVWRANKYAAEHERQVIVTNPGGEGKPN
jgi:hypothetical protein